MATVAEVIAQTLAAYGTEKFFCLMGGDHELWYALEDAKIQIINCRSESAAVYAADGYARISGKPGFVYGQRGPGVVQCRRRARRSLLGEKPGDLAHLVDRHGCPRPLRISGARWPAAACRA